ncbi:MAG: gliding motility-associated C-terminal domain-containing protein [Chitinophagaceae bacterium]
MPHFVKLLLLLSFTGLCTITKAQNGLCPSNLDFEQGDFSGWECRTGSAGAYPLPNVGYVPGRHTIINAAAGGTDPYGLFPQMCPSGNNYCVKLGNSATGAQAESISYTYTIPSTLSTFSMLFYYAVVLEDPGHAPSEQPRFRARIVDAVTGLPVPCVDFDFISGSSTGGFRPSPSNPNVLFKDWTAVSINLNSYIGNTIKLEFITEDCTRGGHFGYAYVDVGTSCNGAISGNYICPGATELRLQAPFGFQGYTWYSDLTFSTILSTNQVLPLTPPPAVGTTFPVIVEPYVGFGCRDTLYARVDVGIPPVSEGGPDQILCKGRKVQLGVPPNPQYTYAWTPSAEVSNPLVSNPFAFPATTDPTKYYITTTDIINGCTSIDSVIVSSFSVDTTLTVVSGKPDFCENETPPVLTVVNTSTPVQWYEVTGGPIPGAVNLTYQPSLTGIYWAQITQGGCVDTTRQYPVYRHLLPLVAFTPSSDTGCITNNSITFTNNTNAPDGAAMSYLWKFSDGITDINTDAVRSFPATGKYNIRLISTTEFGCKDSTDKSIDIVPNGIPDFTWDSICTTRPVQFTNRSNENQSAQTGYFWEFNNGDPVYTLKDPPAVIYNGAPGKLDVMLKMVTLGCENDTQRVVKTVQVNRQAPGYTYKTITVPQGSSHWLHVRDTIGKIYNWKPAINLSSYNTQYTQFFATGDDTKYLIDITDEHTCVTTDTLQMLVLKKPGFYLPTAFTPNGDGLNDLLRPYLIGMKGLKSFSVFNRTGQLIFFTKTYGEGWDGTYQGVKQNTGVFVWVLEYYDNNNKVVLQKGTATLIR